MVIAAECSLESKFALMSSHVLRRAVVHDSADGRFCQSFSLSTRVEFIFYQTDYPVFLKGSGIFGALAGILSLRVFVGTGKQCHKQLYQVSATRCL